MIIITNFFKNITQYSHLGKGIFIPAPFGCKNCGYLGRLHRHGYYQRNVITLHSTVRIHVLRLKCPSCKKTFSVLPSFIIPYYQYSFEFIFLCLYYLYVLNYSYSKVISVLQSSYPHCPISHIYLCSFKKRMHLCSPLVRFFFANFSNFYTHMDRSDPKYIIDKIKLFMDSGNDFNFEYFCRMPKYFFAKP